MRTKRSLKDKEDLKGLLSSNREVIAMTNKELGQTKTVEMRINTGDHPPIKLRPYRPPVHKRKLVKEAVKEMMDSGMIERSKSPWSSPIVIVAVYYKVHLRDGKLDQSLGP